MVIEDVRKGMDTRRAALAAPDGTLTEGLEGHITPGGNFEKRKAFTKLTLPAGTFGLQPVPAGLLVFGSATDPGGFPNDADGNAVTYQRLQHPAVLLGETYSAGSHAMTAVVFSDVYGGKAFVIAQFADGKRYCYYDGSLVRDFTDGLVLTGRATTGEIAADFEATVDRTANYTASTSGSNVNVTGPAGAKYQFSAASTTAGDGDLVATKTSDPIPPVAANAATASFKIMAGSSSAGVNKISKVEINGVTVTNAAVDWTTSNESTAALIAASINTKSSSPEYTAEANGNQVTLIAATSQGDTPNNFTVTITAAGNVCCGDGVFQAVGTGFTVDSLKVNGVNILTALTPAYPGTNTTLSAEVTAIANNINANTGTHGYVACGIGALLYLSKAVTTSDDLPLDVAFILSSGSVVDGSGFVQVNGENASIPAIDSYIQVIGKPRTGTAFGQPYTTWDLNCQVTGGVAPYHYEWVATSSALTNWNAGGDSPNATLRVNGHAKTVAVYCQITDAKGSVKNSPNLTLVTP